MKTDMHLHSDFSDGKNTIEEMTRKAIDLGYNRIAFTDHVWKTTDWIDDYVAEIDRMKKIYAAIKIHSGIEAKVLNSAGDVDAQMGFFRKVNLVLAAFHRIPNGGDGFLSREEILGNKKVALNLWYQAFMGALGNKRVHIIAHPTAILKRYMIELPLAMKKRIAQEAGRHEKIFEVNIKYQTPDNQLFELLQNEKVRFSFGSDSHDVEELAKYKACKSWKASSEVNWELESKAIFWVP